MSVKIESPAGEEALTEFILFQHRVYEYRSARWAAMVAVQLPVLMGEGPFAAGRKIRAFAARVDGSIVARAVAIIDSHYQRHWNEQLGHVVMFEAMPDTRDAVNQMMDAASEWMKANGATAARAGYGLLEFPFVIDDYETLPPDIARQNPAYYHALLKDAGFETERGWVDYKIEVTPELIARYESALEASRRAGFQIVALKDLPAAQRVRDFEHTWNTAFARHWGATPFTTDELDIPVRLLRDVRRARHLGARVSRRPPGRRLDGHAAEFRRRDSETGPKARRQREAEFPGHRRPRRSARPRREPGDGRRTRTCI